MRRSKPQLWDSSDLLGSGGDGDRGAVRIRMRIREVRVMMVMMVGSARYRKLLRGLGRGASIAQSFQKPHSSGEILKRHG